MIVTLRITNVLAACLVCVGMSACGNDGMNAAPGSTPGDGTITSGDAEVVDLNQLTFHPSNGSCAGSDPVTLECIEPIREGLTVTLRGTVVHADSPEQRRLMTPFPENIGDETLVSIIRPDMPMGLPFLCPAKYTVCPELKKGDGVLVVARYQLHRSAYTGRLDQLDPFVESIEIG